SDTIKKKVETVQSVGESIGWERFDKLMQDLGLGSTNGESSAARRRVGGTTVVPVVVEKGNPWLNQLPAYVVSVGELLAQIGMVTVLTIFMLLGREDLRNRFIRLVGYGHMTVTTKAVDDASQRLSRFLLTQAVLNGVFGLAVAVALALIGVQ